MILRTSARLHAGLTALVALVVLRLRAAPERGQGTVEYVALILLVAGVMAVAVAAASKSTFQLDKIVTEQIGKAVKAVSGAK